MKESVYKSYDDLPLFLNSEMVAQVLGVSPSSAYELMHEPGFPVLRIGSRMVVPKEQFVQWVSTHTQGGDCQRTRSPYGVIRVHIVFCSRMRFGSGASNPPPSPSWPISSTAPAGKSTVCQLSRSWLCA